MADKQYGADSWLSVVTSNSGNHHSDQSVAKSPTLLRGNSVATLNQIYQHQNSIPVRSRLLSTAKSLQQSSIDLLEPVLYQQPHQQPDSLSRPQPSLLINSLLAGSPRRSVSPMPERTCPTYATANPPPLVQVINVGQRYRKTPGGSHAGRRGPKPGPVCQQSTSGNRQPRASWAWSSDSSSCSSSHGVSPIRNQSPVHQKTIQGINQLSSSSSSSQSQLNNSAARRSPLASGSLEVHLQHSRSPSPSRSPVTLHQSPPVVPMRQRRMLPEISPSKPISIDHHPHAYPISNRFSTMQAAGHISTPQVLPPTPVSAPPPLSLVGASTIAPLALSSPPSRQVPDESSLKSRQRKLPQIPATQMVFKPTGPHPQPDGRKIKSLSSSSSASSTSFSAGSSLTIQAGRPLLAHLHQQHLANQQLRVQSFPMPTSATSQTTNQGPNKTKIGDQLASGTPYSSSCSNSTDTPSPRSPKVRQYVPPAIGRTPAGVGSASSSSGGSGSNPAIANRSSPGYILSAAQQPAPYCDYFTFDVTGEAYNKTRVLLSPKQEEPPPTGADPNTPPTAVRGRRLSTCGSGLRANFLMNKQHAISEFTPPRSLESSTSRSSTDWLPVGGSSGEPPPSSSSSSHQPQQIPLQRPGTPLTGPLRAQAPFADGAPAGASMNQRPSRAQTHLYQPSSSQYGLQPAKVPYLSVSHQLLTQRRLSGAGVALRLPPRAASATETSSGQELNQQPVLTNIKLNPTALVGVRTSLGQADGPSEQGRLVPGLGMANALSIDVYQSTTGEISPQHQLSPNLTPSAYQRQSLALPARDRQPSNVSSVSMPAGSLATGANVDPGCQTGADQGQRRRFGAWAERIASGPAELEPSASRAGGWRRKGQKSREDTSSTSYSDTNSRSSSSSSSLTESADSVSSGATTSHCESSSSEVSDLECTDQLTLDDRLRLAERSANELFRKVQVSPRDSSLAASRSNAISEQRLPIQPNYQATDVGSSSAVARKASRGRGKNRRRLKRGTNGSDKSNNNGKAVLSGVGQSASILFEDANSTNSDSSNWIATDYMNRADSGKRPANFTDVRADNDSKSNDDDDDDDEQGDDLSLFLRSVDKQRLRQLKSARPAQPGPSGAPSNNAGQRQSSIQAGSGVEAGSLGRGRAAAQALKRAVTLRALVKSLGRRSSSCDSPVVGSAGPQRAPHRLGPVQVPPKAPRSYENLPGSPPTRPSRPASAIETTSGAPSNIKSRAAQLFRRARSSVGQKSSSGELADHSVSQVELAGSRKGEMPNQLKRANRFGTVSKPAQEEPEGAKRLARMRSGKWLTEVSGSEASF